MCKETIKHLKMNVSGNILAEKRFLWISIALSSFSLTIVIIWFILAGEACEIYQTCNYLIVKMEKNRDALFCINETNSALQSLHVYNTQDCKELSRFDIQQTRYMFKNLHYCFNNELDLRNKSRSTSQSHCPLEFRTTFTKICFDSNSILASIQFFDGYLMNPQEAYHLFIYLRLFHQV